MKRLWRVSEAAQAGLLLHRYSAKKPKILTNPFPKFQEPTRKGYSQNPPFPHGLLAGKWTFADTRAREDLCNKVLQLRFLTGEGKPADFSIPLTFEECAKSITVSSRIRNVDLA